MSQYSSLGTLTRVAEAPPPIYIHSLKHSRLSFVADGSSTLVIPYMVLQELDKLKMKGGDSVAEQSKRAIHFIYVTLKDSHKRFVGKYT